MECKQALQNKNNIIRLKMSQKPSVENRKLCDTDRKRTKYRKTCTGNCKKFRKTTRRETKKKINKRWEENFKELLSGGEGQSDNRGSIEKIVEKVRWRGPHTNRAIWKLNQKRSNKWVEDKERWSRSHNAKNMWRENECTGRRKEDLGNAVINMSNLLE